MLVFATWVAQTPAVAEAQDDGARVFRRTPDTVAIYALDTLGGAALGESVANATVVADQSGHGHHAVVEANDGGGELFAATGDPRFAAPGRTNRQARRTAIGPARIAAPAAPFDAIAGGSFTVELYLEREDVAPMANWGILAGNWHSRSLLDDRLDPNTDGVWYGYGLIRHEMDGGFPTGGWRWVMSPVVNGSPRAGHGNGNELWLVPGFELGVGRHYVVLSVDRRANVAIAYVDGLEVSRLANLGADWTFGTPTDHPDRDPARFMMFAGEDDASGGRYRSAPAGVALDSVRVRSTAVSPQEVAAVYARLQAGIPDPPAAATAHWPFDGDFDDVASQLAGTPENGPTFVGGRIGAGAMQLDGSQSLRLPAHEFGDQFTITLWVRPDQIAGGEAIETLLANSGGGRATHGFRFFVNSYDTSGATDHRMVFETGNGTDGAHGSSPPNVITPDAWQHLAVVVNKRRGAVALFRDGVNVTLDDSIRDDFGTSAAFDIGRMGSSALYYSGAIDALRIYDRLLSAAEILAQIPPPEPPELTVQVLASRAALVPMQCVSALATAGGLNGREQVVRYEWRTDDGAFTTGAAMTERSFDGTTGPRSIGVRITTNQMRTAAASAQVELVAPDVLARAAVLVDGVARPPGVVAVPSGATVTLDGSGSTSLTTAGALLCPLTGNQPVPPAPITALLWDTDGDRQPDATDAVVTITAPAGPAQSTIGLLARNAAGGEGTTTVQLDIAAALTPDAGLVATPEAGATPPTPGAGASIGADAAPSPITDPDRQEGLQCGCEALPRDGPDGDPAVLGILALLAIRRRR